MTAAGRPTTSCPACGAREPVDAAWCSQCHRRFDGPDEAATSEPDPDPTVAADERAAGPGERDDDDVGTDRDVRVVDGEVEWRCERCQAWTSLTAATCRRCDAPRRGFGDAAPLPVVAASDVGRLRLASVVLPGAGHLLAGRRGSGAARAVLTVVWLAIGLRLLVAAGPGGPVVPSLPLLVGAGVVWVGSVVDVGRLTVPGARPLLDARVLTWLTVAVVVGSFGASVLALRG